MEGGEKKWKFMPNRLARPRQAGGGGTVVSTCVEGARRNPRTEAPTNVVIGAQSRGAVASPRQAGGARTIDATAYDSSEKKKRVCNFLGAGQLTYFVV